MVGKVDCVRVDFVDFGWSLIFAALDVIHNAYFTKNVDSSVLFYLGNRSICGCSRHSCFCGDQNKMQQKIHKFQNTKILTPILSAYSINAREGPLRKESLPVRRGEGGRPLSEFFGSFPSYAFLPIARVLKKCQCFKLWTLFRDAPFLNSFIVIICSCSLELLFYQGFWRLTKVDQIVNWWDGGGGDKLS